MTTKFKKSNMSVSGVLFIYDGDENKEIILKSLNQSKSGVYCLRNKLNGRLYIGMARNLAVRESRHFRDINSSIHVNNKIMEDWAEYVNDVLSENENACISPSELFEFEVIIYCYPSQLTFWEGILIDSLKPYYNIHKKKEIDTSIMDELDKQLFTESDLIDD